MKHDEDDEGLFEQHREDKIEHRRENWKFFGSHSWIAPVGAWVGVIIALSTFGRDWFIAPIVDSRIIVIKEKCDEKIDAYQEKVNIAFKEQSEVNAAILEKLGILSVTTAELRTEARILNRKRRED